MAQSLLQTLDILEARIVALQEEMSALEARNRALEQEMAELRKKEQEALDNRDRAMLDARYLMMSHRLADNPDTIIETRRTIAGLIRNIDRCIAMLKE